MWFILAFALVIAVPGLIYAIIALMEVPGLAEQRFGPRKGLPSTLNEWISDAALHPGTSENQPPAEPAAGQSAQQAAADERARIIREHPELASSLAGAVRETRLWRDPSAGPFSPGGLFRRATLTLQVRYRDPRTDEIIHAEPDRLINLRKKA